MKKLIVELRANENASRHANRNVPWTPTEIADDAALCRRAGASIIHFHARTADGAAAHDAETYRRVMGEIRDRCDILQAPSLANTPGATARQRIANLLPSLIDQRTRPDFLAIEPGCSNMDLYDPAERRLRSNNRTFINSFETVDFMAETARKHGLIPYLTSFNVSWTRAVAALLEMRAIATPALLLFVMGGPGFIAAHPATRQGFEAHLAFLPQRHAIEWLVCCHGANGLEVAELAIAQGGHVAIGLGDHPYDELGEPTNAWLIEAVAEIGRKYGRALATPDDARAMLHAPLIPQKV